MNTKELILLNNEKREHLTRENRNYYEDMLAYIRFHFTLSERKIEEILLEQLDYLIEEQKKGNTAQDIFGENPKEYCNKLIEEVPQETKGKMFLFGSYILLQLLGWFLIGKGVIDVAFSYFGNVNPTTVQLGSGIAILIIIVILIGAFAVGTLSILKHGVYMKSKRKNIKNFVSIAALFGTTTSLIILVQKSMPSFGVSIKLSGYIILLFGILTLLISRLVNKRLMMVTANSKRT
ncbi:DUF1129 family protein [Salirhabdus salicampi]|uniref:DUF1129 family protein n=1 Tax=Salirhabdus salicampi TaxID=476102 RepID=UPI0020C43ABE|nr:DUF1129 family protein [Salirhabdus salicampi]MCP8615832.1 DUF1129 family protein [Salirhabdus salicampi]